MSASLTTRVRGATNSGMSAAEIISEIKKLAPRERRRVFKAVEELSQAEADRIDNEIADRALARAEFIPWEEAKRKMGLA